MSGFGSVVRRYLIGRALHGGRAHRSQYRPRARRRFGLWGPVPHYSTRTRRGADVSVGGCGCCLPIPLVVALSTAGGLRALWRRVR